MRILSFCCIISFIFNGRRAKAKALYRKTSEMRNWSIPEKIQTGRRAEGWVDWGYTFLKKTSGTFRFVTLPLEIPQNCVTPVGISKVKNEDPWKFHITFSWSPMETAYPQPPCLIFFWSSQLLSRRRLCKSFVLRWND